MIPMKYLNLRALIEQGSGAVVVDLLKAALNGLPRGILFVTLDLAAAKDYYRETDVALLVHLIRERWPQPACCLARCDHPLAWSRAAAALSQPLLSWRALAKQGDYTILGQSPRGDYARLLRALCLTHEEASAEQLAHDATIISPRKMNFDHRSTQRWLLRGIPPFGPNQADIGRIGNDLHNMARQRYIVEVSPGRFRAVLPTPSRGFSLNTR